MTYSPFYTIHFCTIVIIIPDMAYMLGFLTICFWEIHVGPGKKISNNSFILECKHVKHWEMSIQDTTLPSGSRSNRGKIWNHCGNFGTSHLSPSAFFSHLFKSMQPPSPKKIPRFTMHHLKNPYKFWFRQAAVPITQPWMFMVRSFSFPAVLTRWAPDKSKLNDHSPSRGDVMHLGPAPNDPLHKQGTGGWPGWAPEMASKLLERAGGRPGLTQGS